MTKPAKTGRPRFEITPEVCTKAEALAAKGLTKVQIAGQLGIHYDTLNEKSKAYDDFSEALKKGQSQAIGSVENRLYETALAGNVTAMLFFLKCRAGWNEKDAETPAQTPWPSEIKIVSVNAKKPEEMDDDELNQAITDVLAG